MVISKLKKLCGDYLNLIVSSFYGVKMIDFWLKIRAEVIIFGPGSETDP